MDVNARSARFFAPAAVLALAVAVCLLAVPAGARAAGISLGDMFGNVSGALGQGVGQGAPEAAPEVDPAPEAAPEPVEPDPGYVVGFGPSLPPGAEAPSVGCPAEPEGDPAVDCGLPDDPAADPAEPVEPTTAPEPALPQAERPSLPAVYEELTGETIPNEPDDPVNQAALSCVGYDAAGVMVWIPQDYDIVALDEVFVVAMEGDFYLDVTQIYSNFEEMGGEEALVDFLAELAAEDPAVEVFPLDENGRAVPYVNAFGTPIYSIRMIDEREGVADFSLYIPTLDGRLTNMWFSVPLAEEDGAGYYEEVMEFMVETVLLIEPGTDPVDAAAIAVEGQPAATELVGKDGLEFAAYGMEYDPEFEGWSREDDQFVYVGVYADFFEGATGLTEDDLYDAAVELAEMGGVFVAESRLEAAGATVHTYVGVSEDGFVEVYAFVPMPDGTVTLLGCLVELGDTASANTLAAVLQSIAYANDVAGAAAGLIAEGDAAFGEGAAAGPVIDPDYLARSAKLV